MALGRGGGGGGGALSWETMSTCSLDTNASCGSGGGYGGSGGMPREIGDLGEEELRELARWFKVKENKRRRVIRRYRAGEKRKEELERRKALPVVDQQQSLAPTASPSVESESVGGNEDPSTIPSKITGTKSPFISRSTGKGDDVGRGAKGRGGRSNIPIHSSRVGTKGSSQYSSLSGTKDLLAGPAAAPTTPMKTSRGALRSSPSRGVSGTSITPPMSLRAQSKDENREKARERSGVKRSREGHE
ncbi:unnamed protein product [Choristocarpus tenellus]